MIPYTNIHTHRPPTLEPKECIGISSFRLGYDSVLPPAPFSAGIHPWDATEAYHRLPELLQQLKRCGAAAVGEIGLDHASGRRNESCQTTVLTAQLQSASALRLPVIIHCVKAFELLMELLAAYSLPAVIFHGYTGSPQQTERLFAPDITSRSDRYRCGRPKRKHRSGKRLSIVFSSKQTTATSR